MIKSLLKILGGRGSDNAPAPVAPSESPEGFRDLENFVDYIVRTLVDNPEEVRIATTAGEDIDVININCNKTDIGKIVGKRGKTIMAIRSLVSGAASRLERKVTVEVVDD